MEPLIIKDFHKGIAPSPYLGFADMRNVDIETPGIVKIKHRTEKKSGTTVTEIMRWLIQDPSDASDYYGIDDNGQIYKSTDAGDTWTTVAGNSAGGGQGMTIWKDYLFVAGTTKLEAYGPLSGVPAWSTSWQVLDTATYHPMLSAQDDILYIGAGRYVASLMENAGQTFAPGTGASFTYTARALDLPTNYKIKCLAELGKNLMIGTYKKNLTDFVSADIFPWDRTSSSFNLPLRLNDNGINALITINNLLYIFPGVQGKICVSNGTQVSEVAQIPESIIDISGGTSVRIEPGAVITHKGKLYFGLYSTSSPGGIGVWSFKLGKDENYLKLEHVLSHGLYADKVGALAPVSRNTFLIGWEQGATSGIDKISTSKRYTSYAAYFDSAFYPVGTTNLKKAFSEIEFQLTKPLVSSQGIKLSYRTNLTDNFTAIGTFDFATYGGIQSFVGPANIINAQFVQIRCELTTGESDNSPELRHIILRQAK